MDVARGCSRVGWVVFEGSIMARVRGCGWVYLSYDGPRVAIVGGGWRSGLQFVVGSCVKGRSLVLKGVVQRPAVCACIACAAQGTLQYGSVSPNGSYVLEDEVGTLWQPSCVPPLGGCTAG